MASNVEVTEFERLDADELHLVKNGANGFPPLLAKSVLEEIETAKKSDSPEADAQEKEMTEEAAKMGLCGDESCEVCKEKLAKSTIEEATKAKLTSAARNSLPDSAFVFPKKRKFPINDESHARNALSRAGGKKVEGKVRGAVGRKFPGIAQKSPGNPSSANSVPPIAESLPQWPTSRHDHMGEPSYAPSSGHTYTPFKTEDVTSYPSPDDARIKPQAQPQGIGSAAGVSLAVASPVSAQGRPFPGTMDAFNTKKSYAHAALATYLEQIAEFQKDSGSVAKMPWMVAPNPEAKPSEQMTLGQVADGLAACGRALDSLTVSAEELPIAKQVLDCALGVVARIASGDAKPEDLEKAGWHLSKFSPATVAAARNQLSSLLDAPKTSDSPEADTIMTELTKEQIDQLVSDKAAIAVKSNLKKERKALKKEIKKLQAALKAASSNNKGEVSVGDMQSAVGDKRTADDIAISGSNVRKDEKSKKVKKGKELAKQLQEVRDIVSKMSQQPRVGGPHLTGVPASGVAAPVAEGRQGEPVAKSADDAEIEKLEKQMEDVLKSGGSMAATRLQDITYQLSRKRLSMAHARGEI